MELAVLAGLTVDWTGWPGGLTVDWTGQPGGTYC